MLTALISDIHANLEALTAVLEDIEKKKPDRIVCLGDVINYGPDPVKCLQMARRWDICLMGNHEEAMLTRPVGFNVIAVEAMKWTKNLIEPHLLSTGAKTANWNFIKNLPLRHVEGDVLLVHASPRQPTTEYILPNDVDMLLGSDKLEKCFELIDRACFVGHTHLPGAFPIAGGYFHPDELGGEFWFRKGEKAIINVGSVGQPRDRNNKACYATFDGEAVKWYRVEYDFEKTMQKVLNARGLPEWCGKRLLKGE